VGEGGYREATKRRQIIVENEKSKKKTALESVKADMLFGGYQQGVV